VCWVFNSRFPRHRTTYPVKLSEGVEIDLVPLLEGAKELKTHL